MKNVFGKLLCNICLNECKVKHLEQLHVCDACFEKVKALEKAMPFKLSKEQIAGGTKDEL